MDAETIILITNQKELDAQLNLENNYMSQAYQDFIEFRELAKECLEKGYVTEKKFEKTYGKTIKHFEKIFEPTPDNQEEEEAPDKYAFFKKLFHKQKTAKEKTEERKVIDDAEEYVSKLSKIKKL